MNKVNNDKKGTFTSKPSKKVSQVLILMFIEYHKL